MKVAVIGAGKMGCALAQGMIRSGLAAAEEIVGVGRSEESKAKFLALDPKLTWSPDIAATAARAEVILLGVKPVQILEVLQQASRSNGQALYLSVAAGVTLASMQTVLGNQARLVRAMPNTPVVVGAGVTAYALAEGVTAGDKQWIHEMFSSLGKAYEVREKELDAVTALSGSGPAYFYLFASLLEKAAIREGLSSELAREMAAQTALGAAKMLERGGASPDELIAQVKSKGGTTEAALNVFAAGDLEKLVGDAVAAAAGRSRELSARK